VSVNDSTVVRTGALCGDGLGGWWIAEDEEFDENADQDHNGDLAEKKALGEGEAMLWLVNSSRYGSAFFKHNVPGLGLRRRVAGSAICHLYFVQGERKLSDSDIGIILERRAFFKQCLLLNDEDA
jgi:hypothetical protein